jgi:hypothetical protein
MYGTSIKHQRRVIHPCLSTCDPLCISPRAQCDGAVAASNRLGTSQGWSQGPRKASNRASGLRLGDTGLCSRSTGGVIGPYFISLCPSVCIAEGTNDMAASKRPGMREGWSPGPRQVCPVHRAFGRGLEVSILHERRGDWPIFRQFLTLCVYRQGHKRRSGGSFKRT